MQDLSHFQLSFRILMLLQPLSGIRPFGWELGTHLRIPLSFWVQWRRLMAASRNQLLKVQSVVSPMALPMVVPMVLAVVVPIGPFVQAKSVPFLRSLSLVSSALGTQCRLALDARLDTSPCRNVFYCL